MNNSCNVLAIMELVCVCVCVYVCVCVCVCVHALGGGLTEIVKKQTKDKDIE